MKKQTSGVKSSDIDIHSSDWEESSCYPPPGTVQCKICGRFFNEDRISKHQHVCRVSLKERSVFDAGKHRVKGTEAEKYYKPLPPRGSSLKQISPTSVAQASTSVPAKAKSNWRQKHEEFLAAIRAAKEMQAFLAKGGKLSDLPPSTPSEHLDYVQCPYCLRKFKEASADRHIPKCAKILKKTKRK